MSRMQTYNHWRKETDAEQITWLYFDKKNASINTLDLETMEELSNIVSDELRDTLLEYQRQYGTIAPWTELPAPLALKNSSWDSGYSTAESANHSPAP